MAQGKASQSSVGDTKREPISHAVNISSVAEMGAHQLHVNGRSEPLYEGRGYEAPLAGTTTHHCGSQGKHR